MDLKLLLVSAFLFAILALSHAALPSVVYWNSQLPGSPMPKVIKDLLKNEWLDVKNAQVGVGKGGVGVQTGGGTNVGVNHGGVHVYARHRGRPVYVGVTPGPHPFVYNYAATETQLHDNPNVALFFMEKDLHQGKTLNLQFVKIDNRETLLPRKLADSIPFSSKYTPEILEEFSVKPQSKEAGIIKKTIYECEEAGIKGEEKYCATSLESMVDFSVSKLGKNIQAISTDANQQNQKQKYTISDVKKMDKDDEAVVCHKQNYPYAVFYCHKTGKTEAFSVNLVSDNGENVEAVAICHKDTSAWNPKHLAFQVLKVKPGTVAVCHFLPENHIVWVRK